MGKTVLAVALFFALVRAGDNSCSTENTPTPRSSWHSRCCDHLGYKNQLPIYVAR